MLRSFSRTMSSLTRKILDPASDTTQFSKARLINHGELCDGELPEALKYDRPFELTTLSNGIRVASETYPSKLSTVGVVIEAGSRNETMENAGTAHFLEHCNFKGTKRRDRLGIELGTEQFGGNLNAFTSREMTLYQMQCFEGDEDKALDMLSDMLLHSTHKTEAVEAEKEVILREAQHIDEDHKEFVLENVHYAAYRDHMIGQPILGNKRSIQAITRDDLVKFVDTHYIGPRMLVVGCGGIKHDKLVDLGEKFFGKVKKSSDTPVINTDTPAFTGSQILIRDDDLDLAYSGVFYSAPGWNDPDYFAFLLLQRIMGDYDPKRDSIINHPQLQYNHLHNYLGEMEDIARHECMYIPYSDCGLFGHFTGTLDVSAFLPPVAVLKATTQATKWISDAEMYRARNKLYDDLLKIETGEEIMQNIGAQLIYMGRRIPRSEIAARVSRMDARYLERVYSKWLWDTELAMAHYGPIFMSSRAYGIYRAHTNDTNQI